MITVKNKKKKMNKTRKIGIKDDFYNFTNKRWLKKIKIRPYSQSVDLYNILQEKVDKDIYEKIIKNNKSFSNLELSVKNHDDKLTEKHLIRLLEQANVYFEKNDLNDFLIFCMKENIDIPFDWDVSLDKKNLNYYKTHIGEDGLTFSNRDYYILKGNHFVKIRNYFMDYLNNIYKSCLLPINEDFNMSNVFNLEKELALKQEDIEKSRYMSNVYNTLTIPELNKLGFNWKDFSEKLGYKKLERNIVVSNVGYLKFLMNKLKDWNKEPWLSYWKYKIVSSLITTHSKWRQLEFNFNDKQLLGIKKEYPVHNKFMDKSKLYFNTYLNKTYVRSFNYTENKKCVEKMYGLICNMYLRRINENNWVEEKTRNNIIKKLKNMKIVIGKKDEYIDDPTFEIKENDQIHNAKMYRDWSINTRIGLLDKKITSKLWRRFIGVDTFDINAFYIPGSNEIIVPHGILQEPFMNHKKELYYNLAMFGTSIAHEITHAFNDDGTEYDENGLFTNNFWSKRDKKIFEKKSENIKKIYKKYARDKGKLLNEEYSYGENFADIIGLTVCEDILITDIKCRNLNIKQEESELKKFYELYASQWKSKLRKKAELHKVLSDEHASSMIRCNCSLMMSKYFSKIYKIEKKNLMYNTDTDTLW